MNLNLLQVHKVRIYYNIICLFIELLIYHKMVNLFYNNLNQFLLISQIQSINLFYVRYYVLFHYKTIKFQN